MALKRFTSVATGWGGEGFSYAFLKIRNNRWPSKKKSTVTSICVVHNDLIVVADEVIC